MFGFVLFFLFILEVISLSCSEFFLFFGGEGDILEVVIKLINYVSFARGPLKIHQYFIAGKISVRDTTITGARTMLHVVCLLTPLQVLLV